MNHNLVSEQNPHRYDCIIIGGGFAGLSAAIYLARFNRSVIIIDKGEGRWNTHEINENYLGFPEGISAQELHKKGIAQAERFGAIYQKDTVIDISKNDEMFVVKGMNDIYFGKTVLFATGVIDKFPHFKDWNEYVGRSLFWCITCDGSKTKEKRIVIVGNTNDAACDAMQFLTYTNTITFVTNSQKGQNTLSSLWRTRLHNAAIPIYEDTIRTISGKNGFFDTITLSKGDVIKLDYMICEQGAMPQSELAIKLGVTVDEKKYIIADVEQRTNVVNIYAAGDITKEFSQQIATAVHEGSMAAQSINYDMYKPEQKES